MSNSSIRQKKLFSTKLNLSLCTLSRSSSSLSSELRITELDCAIEIAHEVNRDRSSSTVSNRRVDHDIESRHERLSSSDTIKTLVSRLVSKGVVRQEKRKVYYYSPLVSEEEYASWATGDLITRLYNGSARDLVAALVHSEGLTKEDIEELRGMFRVED